ncbi:MAG: hypothetical protein MUD01_11470, partial [Chloroflexaceae bacterium]|nr:hypothetical protein [Chloroflexaceae bacterium]
MPQTEEPSINIGSSTTGILPARQSTEQAISMTESQLMNVVSAAIQGAMAGQSSLFRNTTISTTAG